MLEYEMAARVRRFGALEARVGLVSVCVCALNVRFGITTTIIISDCLFVPRYDLQNVFAVAAVLVAFRAHALFACALAAAASSSSSSRVFICPMQNGPAPEQRHKSLLARESMTSSRPVLVEQKLIPGAMIVSFLADAHSGRTNAKKKW